MLACQCLAQHFVTNGCLKCVTKMKKNFKSSLSKVLEKKIYYSFCKKILMFIVLFDLLVLNLCTSNIFAVTVSSLILLLHSINFYLLSIQAGIKTISCLDCLGSKIAQPDHFFLDLFFSGYGTQEFYRCHFVVDIYILLNTK